MLKLLETKDLTCQTVKRGKLCTWNVNAKVSITWLWAWVSANLPVFSLYQDLNPKCNDLRSVFPYSSLYFVQYYLFPKQKNKNRKICLIGCWWWKLFFCPMCFLCAPSFISLSLLRACAHVRVRSSWKDIVYTEFWPVLLPPFTFCEGNPGLVHTPRSKTVVFFFDDVSKKYLKPLIAS